MEPAPPLSLFSQSTRKQNLACDACRAKKIRCQRVTTAQRCGQCAAKDLECTSNYIEQLQNKPRRPRRFKSSEGRDRERDLELSRRVEDSADDNSGCVSPPDTSRSARGSGTSRRASDSSRDPGPSTASLGVSLPPSASRDAMAIDDPLGVFSWIQPTSLPLKRDAAALQTDMLRYLFSPVPVLHQEWRYSDVWCMEQTRAGACDIWEEAGGRVWEEAPSAAHLSFWGAGAAELEAIAVELIDAFFTIVDPRLPILDAHAFLARFQAPTTPEAGGPLPHGLLAVVLAFGARFIDHDVFRADREECTARDIEGTGCPRSRLVQLLVIRAREVAEMNKSCRNATLANAQAMMLLEGLLGQSAVLKLQYRACNLGVASRHLEQIPDVPIMHVTVEKDEKARTQLALYFITGCEAALYRLPPSTWTTQQFYSASYEPMVDSGPAPLMHPGGEDLWLRGARPVAGIMKRFCADLWDSRVRANGIPLALLRDFVHKHSSWRDVYLGQLGIPASFPSSDQDFATTMKAATADILFHGMWLVAERAVRDFGIQEAEDAGASSGSGPAAIPAPRHMYAFEVQQMKDRLGQEAMHSAMRITMLAALAAEQGLLRLDPLILYRPIYDAGLFLARRGQDESLGCVAGLKQYATAYPQMWELADEIQAVLQKNHVSAAAAPATNVFTVNGGAASILA